MTTVTIQYDESNNAIKQLLSVIRSLGASVSRSRKKAADPTLLSKQEFYDQIDLAKQQAREGKVESFSSTDDMRKYFDSL
ncbi:MAG: hypothetical protein MJZ32_02265 [Bacteroidaceae bacterium]|nr:hypothetical protein [Bacteroidaceae bacterium]